MTDYVINSVKRPTVAIAINKSVIPTFLKKKVYLKNGAEFQIEIFNPCTETIAARISLNDKLISNSLLVLKPGQRIWLERFLDDNKKFIFKTYFVENSPETIKAIQNNGKLLVEFFKEKNIQDNFLLNNNSIGCIDVTNYASPLYSYLGDINYVYLNSTINATVNGRATKDCFSTSKNQIETGRIEQGNLSAQQFDTYYGDFESRSFYNVNLEILPMSAKPLFKKDIENKRCLNCGKKAKAKDKFCSKCGFKFL